MASDMFESSRMGIKPVSESCTLEVLIEMTHDLA